MTFDDVEIDLERFELRRGGAPVSVEPKVFDLIRYLAENANRLISKDELIETVWQGRIVSDAALSSAIKSARRAIGDADVSASRIKTVRGRGFRMELDGASGKPEQASKAGASAPAVFVQPSFAVLPPRDVPQGLDSAALQRRISNAAAGIPFLTVVASPVARQLVDASPEDMMRTIGKGFALDLTGHQDGLDCVLFDVETGRSLWSYDCPMVDTHEAVADILVRLEPQIVRAIHTAISMSPEAPSPRALTIQALGTMSLKGWNSAAFAEAEGLLRKAVDLEPDLGYARAAISLIMALGPRAGFIEPDETRRKEAIVHAEKAIELEPMTPNVLGLAGCALVDAGQELRGKAVLERGLSYDANNSQSLAALGTAYIKDRRLDDAVQLLTKAIGISPNDGRIAIWSSMLALACMMSGDTTRAMKAAERAVAADDRTHLSRIVLAAIALSDGDQDKAKEAWADAHRVTPNLAEAQIAAVIGPKMAAELTKAFA